jgi:hypothetical protein
MYWNSNSIIYRNNTTGSVTIAMEYFFYLTKLTMYPIIICHILSYGIMSRMNSRFQSHWANQEHFIETNHSDARNNRVNRYRSSYMKISHSVPYGSVIGPLLFFLCINDLPFSIHGAHLVMFANYINTLRTGDANLRLLRYNCERRMTQNCLLTRA